MKALIVDEPWISGILFGNKIWEMRKKRITIRGQIALIRKGSSHVVGVAEVIGCEPPIDTLAAYVKAEPKHQIPAGRQASAFERGWRTPWVLAKAKPLPRPVHYQHPNGAVTWVILDESVASEIRKQLTL